MPNVYNKNKLRCLMELAEGHLEKINCPRVICEELVRDKTVAYFRDILGKHGGMMTPYLKAHHGDPKCPVNGVLSGLFFGALLTGTNTSCSVYGEKRLIVSTSALVAYNSRAYFADFYCVSGKSYPRPHYVTIVITTAGTEADKICRSRLIAFHINNNPFFQVRKNGDSIKAEVARDQKLHVELILTDAIDVRALVDQGLAALMDISLASYGSEARHPRPKLYLCSICNLEIEPESSTESSEEDGALGCRFNDLHL